MPRKKKQKVSDVKFTKDDIVKLLVSTEIPTSQKLGSQSYDQIKNESILERLRNFTECFDGFFSLDASSLLLLSEAPDNANIFDRLSSKTKIFDFESKTLDTIKNKILALEKEMEIASKQNKEDLDYVMKQLMGKMEKLREESRIKLSEETNNKKANESSILQLDL